jgi:hypothetical protein
MKTSYTEIKSPRQWKATTGVSQEHFHALAKLFRSEFQILFGKSKSELALDSPKEIHVKTEEDLLFLVLFSLKTGMTEDVLGLVLGVERSTFSKNRAIGLKVLSSALQRIGVMPQREFKDVEEFEAYMKDHPELLIDGTENRVQRPHDQGVQKDFYSGKKNATR